MITGALFFVAIVMLIGLAVRSTLAPDSGFSESLGIILISGSGLLAQSLVLLSLAGWKPSGATIGAIGILAAMIVIPNRRAILPKISFSSAPIALALAMTLAAILISFYCIAFGTLEWDTFMVWDFKARVMLDETLQDRPGYFESWNLSYSNRRYPLMVPALHAASRICAGVIGIHAPVLYLGLGAMLFGFFRRFVGERDAAILVGIQMALPALIRWSSSGNADLALTAFHAAGTCCLVNWIRDRTPQNLSLAILFTCLLALTKDEGLPLAVAKVLIVAGILSRRRSLSSQNAFTFAFCLAVSVPWFLWQQGIPTAYESHFAIDSTMIENLPRILHLIPALVSEMGDLSRWSVLWILLPVMGLAGSSAIARPEVKVLWALLLFEIALYIGAYVVTPDKTFFWKQLFLDTIERLLLHATPTAVMLLGFHHANASKASETG